MFVSATEAISQREKIMLDKKVLSMMLIKELVIITGFSLSHQGQQGKRPCDEDITIKYKQAQSI